MLHRRRIALAALAGVLVALAPPTGPDWTALGNTHFGASVAGAGDVNGDGYEDVLVGEPDDSSAAPNAGKVSLFLGGPSGLEANPAWTLPGRAGDYFGAFLAAAGDIDADGLGDVVIAGAGTGTVYVFRGDAGRGLSAAPDWETSHGPNDSWLPMPVTGLGDLNGDGCSEIAVGVPWDHGGGAVFVWSFPPPPPPVAGVPNALQQPECTVLAGLDTSWEFGRHLAVGNFDGDTIPDLAVACQDVDPAAGAKAFVRIYAGANLPDGAIWWQAAESADDAYGESIAAADINGDGMDDVLVGAPYYHDANGDKIGAVFAYFMTADGSANGNAVADAIVQGQPGEFFGIALAVADIDDDGLQDFVVGAPGDWGHPDADGRVLVYLGQTGYGPVVTPSVEYLGQTDHHGAALASADVNKDGHSDLLIGGPQYNGGQGRVVCYHGQETEPQPPTSVTMQRSDGSTVPPGGSTSEATLVVSAVVNHPGMVPSAIQVQVGAVTTPFPPDGSFAASSPEVPSGATATATVGGLQPGQSYWVRVRAGDGAGRVSDWTHVGTASSSEVDVMTAANLAPSVAMLRQLRVADAVAIAPATSLVTDRVRFRADVSDADGDSFVFAVELRHVGESFTGVPTGTAGPFAPGQVSIELAVPEGAVKWQAWAVSSAFGMESPKVRFGSGSQVDFFILAFGSVSKGACSVSGQDAGGFPGWTLLSAAAFLRRRRRRPAR